MPPAARVGDSASHPGVIAGPGAVTVLIGGKPAATVGTLHTCSMPPTAGPHPPSSITGGSSTVSIGGNAAARLGDSAGCGSTIITGDFTVMIG